MPETKLEIPPVRGRNLYDIVTDRADLAAVLEQLDYEEHAEAIEELTRQLDVLDNLELPHKVESLCRVIRNLEGRALMLEDERKRLAERQKTAEGKVTRLRDYLRSCLDVAQTRRVSAGLFEVSVRANGGNQPVDRERIEQALGDKLQGFVDEETGIPGVCIVWTPTVKTNAAELPAAYVKERGSHLAIR